MRICVTGSAGFIGRHTVRLLCARGHTVLGIDRHPFPNDLGDLYTHLRGDVTSARTMLGIFEVFRPEAVMHLAASASLQRSLKNAPYDAKQNVMGTVMTIGAAQHVGCSYFVFASTSAVYAPNDAGQYWEHSTIRPISPYGVSKLAGEWYTRISGLQFAVLRYGNVYGPEQKAVGENALVPQILEWLHGRNPNFRINGDGDQTRDWIYVEDVAKANYQALMQPPDSSLNIGTGIGTSVNEVIHWTTNAVANLNKSFWVAQRHARHAPAKSGELRNVRLIPGMAKRFLRWEAQFPVSIGMRKTAESWSK